MRFALTVLLCLLSLASAAIRKGPYLVCTAGAGGMAVHWQLDVTAACTLSWGANTSYELGSTTITKSGSGGTGATLHSSGLPADSVVKADAACAWGSLPAPGNPR